MAPIPPPKLSQASALPMSTLQPTTDPYKVIPANPAYEGKQRNPCANCHSDTPSRHYYQQCQQLCQFKDCLSKNSLPSYHIKYLTQSIKSQMKNFKITVILTFVSTWIVMIMFLE